MSSPIKNPRILKKQSKRIKVNNSRENNTKEGNTIIKKSISLHVWNAEVNANVLSRSCLSFNGCPQTVNKKVMCIRVNMQ